MIGRILPFWNGKSKRYEVWPGRQDPSRRSLPGKSVIKNKPRVGQGVAGPAYRSRSIRLRNEIRFNRSAGIRFVNSPTAALTPCHMTAVCSGSCRQFVHAEWPALNLSVMEDVIILSLAQPEARVQAWPGVRNMRRPGQRHRRTSRCERQAHVIRRRAAASGRYEAEPNRDLMAVSLCADSGRSRQLLAEKRGLADIRVRQAGITAHSQSAMEPIRRGKGVTESERYLAQLANSTFLELWSYPNTFIDKRSAAIAEGKELADLLVACGDDVIIFSDKSIAWPSGDVGQSWSRWYRRAVKKSVDQIRGAERWLRQFPERVFLDRACSQKLPIELSLSGTAPRPWDCGGPWRRSSMQRVFFRPRWFADGARPLKR